MKRLLTIVALIALILHAESLHNAFLATKSASIPLIDVGYMRATGFFVNTPKGHKVFMTAAHVCRTFLPGFYEVIIAKDTDLCVVKLPNSKDPALSLAHSYRDFEPVWVLGFPFGETLTLTQGSFAGQLPGIQGEMEPVITAQVYPGNSGSPVLDMYGHVVGLISACRPYTNRTLIISLNRIRDFLADK